MLLPERPSSINTSPTTRRTVPIVVRSGTPTRRPMSKRIRPRIIKIDPICRGSAWDLCTPVEGVNTQSARYVPAGRDARVVRRPVSNSTQCTSGTWESGPMLGKAGVVRQVPYEAGRAQRRGEREASLRVDVESAHDLTSSRRSSNYSRSYVPTLLKKKCGRTR